VAESAGEKTEPASPRRRAEARENGQIARSQDLSNAALFLAAVLLLSSFGTGIVEAFKQSMQTMLSPQMLHDFNIPGMWEAVLTIAISCTTALAPILIGLMVVAVVINIAQVGFFLSTKRIEPKIEALSPFKGLKKLFGQGQGVVTLLMNLVKLVLIAFVAYSAIYDRMGLIVLSQKLDGMQIFGLGTEVVYAIALRIALFLFVLAIIDYVYQRYKTEKQLKMTKQEVKDELKKMDGDPQIKQRRRQIAQQRAMQRVRKDVPTADVIVTNPTHFAIALKYEPGSMHAPRVVAKGIDFLALRIREVAVEHGIPILERPPLARALYKTVEVGQEIPEEYYAAVAEILAYVYEISGRAKRLVPT
jgi:flagellar biosynthesis protein FlhB